ncbi:Developmental and secondary metabolism regulator veA [Fusarium oxysporum f. sp. albedinis]|nr:Developmental and secondary metabolism regulator veA [Fusarium oxysporum f. sp. albedinis]
MDETTRPELKSLISTTGSHVSPNPPNGQPTGLGESLQLSSPSWLRRVGLTVPLLLIPIAYTSSERCFHFVANSIRCRPWTTTQDHGAFSCRTRINTRLSRVPIASQTTASALQNILTMGWIGNWAIGVIAVWSLSPLGGQAALRSLRLQQNPTFTEIPATYYLGNNRSKIREYYRIGVDVFQGASSKGHRDLWGNVRIAFLELLPGYNGDDPNAWISVPEDEIVPYASLIGLQIRGGSFERPGNSTMTVHFHYQTLSCGEAFSGSEWVRNGSKVLWYHNTSSSIPLSTIQG